MVFDRVSVFVPVDTLALEPLIVEGPVAEPLATAFVCCVE
jgi:hypothetical protein